jgi:hypothetical protein
MAFQSELSSAIAGTFYEDTIRCSNAPEQRSIRSVFVHPTCTNFPLRGFWITSVLPTTHSVTKVNSGERSTDRRS